MTIRTLSGLAGALLCSASLGAQADAAVWKGNVELGYLQTAGNTRNASLNFKARAETGWAEWKNTLNLEAASSASREATTAERYLLNDQLARQLSAHRYAFGFAGYERDRFSGYDYRFSSALGYGYRALETDALTVDLEAAPGLRHSREQGADAVTEFIARAAFKAQWKLGEHSALSEAFNTEIGRQGAVSRSVTALQNRINGNLSSKISLTLDHQSRLPDATLSHLNSELAVTLVYSFE